MRYNSSRDYSTTSRGAATLDGEWKAVEGASSAEKAAMRFFKVVVEVP